MTKSANQKGNQASEVDKNVRGSWTAGVMKRGNGRSARRGGERNQGEGDGVRKGSRAEMSAGDLYTACIRGGVGGVHKCRGGSERRKKLCT